MKFIHGWFRSICTSIALSQRKEEVAGLYVEVIGLTRRGTWFLQPLSKSLVTGLSNDRLKSTSGAEILRISSLQVGNSEMLITSYYKFIFGVAKMVFTSSQEIVPYFLLITFIFDEAGRLENKIP